MAELTLNEKRLLAALSKEKKANAVNLACFLNATPEAVVQWAHLAEDKELAKVERIVEKEFEYTEEGKTYLQNGLPETQILKIVKPVQLLPIFRAIRHLKSVLASYEKKGSSGLLAL